MIARAARRLGDGGPALVLIAMAALLPALVSTEYVLLAASMIVTMLVAVSFNLLLGYTGMFSFGQAAFYGLGAYTTGLLMNHAGAVFYLALAAGIAIAVLAGLLSGIVLVPLEPIAFIMLTFALGDLLEFVAEHARGLTGGDSGLIVSLPSSLNVVVGVNGVYYLMLGVAVAALAAAFAFVKTTPGLIVRGIREDPLRARTLGIAVNRRRQGVFALSAGIAAVGGGLSVLSAQIVYPDVFDWRLSANALIVTLLGGVGRFSGPVVGAVLLGLIDFYVGRLTTDTLLVEGLIFLAVILIAPRGVTALGRGGLLDAPARILRRARIFAAGRDHADGVSP
jgi:branched-chain amino acid transport system permease protein